MDLIVDCNHINTRQNFEMSETQEAVDEVRSIGGVRSIETKGKDIFVEIDEGKKLVIRVAGAQGYKVDKEDQVYESLTSLLMAISPAFSNHFHSTLYSKLLQV